MKNVFMAPASPLTCVLVKLDGKEWSVTFVFLCPGVSMDTVTKHLNVYVNLATEEDFVIFVSIFKLFFFKTNT